MKSVNERNLEAVQRKRDEISQKSTAILTAQAEEDRQLSDDETKDLAQAVANMKTLDDEQARYTEAVRVEKDVLDFGRKIGGEESSKGFEFKNDVQVVAEHKSIGQIFTESEQFKSIQDQGTGSSFSTGAVDLSTKGTLLSGTLAPGSGSGGGFLAVPDVAPGVVDKLFQPLTVADIIPSGQTNSNTIRYIVEGTATSGAAGVLEGGAKPESTLGVSTTDEQVKKIATTLVVSDEMLEDAAQVESYINSRLGLFIRIEEERQLLLGSTSAEIPGIIGRSGVNTYTLGTVDNNAVGIFKALNGTRGSALLEPDYIIMNPANWQNTRLLMDANNQFYGGGPFTGAYGNQPTPEGVTSGQLTGATDSLWNKPVIVTSAIGAGTALLGAFRAASQIYRKTGLTVEATNSHASLFTSNLVAIRAELREALCVYRPASFTKIVGLNS